MMNVAERKQASAPTEAQHWLASFEAALRAQDAAAAADLFQHDGLWRDVLAFTWNYPDACPASRQIEATLRETLARARRPEIFIFPRNERRRAGSRAPAPRQSKRCSNSKRHSGRAPASLRLVPDPQAPSRLRAWTLVTTLEELRGHEEALKKRAAQANDGIRDFGGDNWIDRPPCTRYPDRDPAVLVIGGGQAGLSIAARLQAARRRHAGDRQPRADRRQLAHALSLPRPAQRVHVNHLPYMPFPPTWPVYIPKDMLADWFEAYAEAMELNFWTGTELVGGATTTSAGRWNATLRRADGTERTLHPRHLVFANGVGSFRPSPPCPGWRISPAPGDAHGDFTNGAPLAGGKALVIGTGTSGHDVAQDLHAKAQTSPIDAARPDLCRQHRSRRRASTRSIGRHPVKTAT